MAKINNSPNTLHNRPKASNFSGHQSASAILWRAPYLGLRWVLVGILSASQISNQLASPTYSVEVNTALLRLISIIYIATEWNRMELGSWREMVRDFAEIYSEILKLQRIVS